MVYSLSKIAFKSLFLFVCLFVSKAAYSAVVSGLFHSDVEVVSQLMEDRQSAFNEALLKTLIKVSGHRELTLDPTLQAAFFPAERYVQSFSYKENPRYSAYIKYQEKLATEQRELGITSQTKFEQIPALQNTENDKNTFKSPEYLSHSVDINSEFVPTPLPYILEVEFSAKALEQKMRNMNLPIWGNVRPEIMFWVLVESNGERNLLGLSNESQQVNILSKIANDYALPVSFPESDDLDLSMMTISDLWGLFPDAIDRAKLRYRSNGNLMVRIYQSVSDTWSANWHLSINDLTQIGSLHNASLPDIYDELLSFLAVNLSNRFSMNSEAPGNYSIALDVADIENFKHYVDVQNFLEESALVKAFSLERMVGSIMSFNIELNTSLEQFREYLELSGKLAFISTSSVSSAPEAPGLLTHNINENTSLVLDTQRYLQKEAETPNVIQEKYVYKWLSVTPGSKKNNGE